MKVVNTMLNPREIREHSGLNQTEFWGQIGVTQSAGSRYETGRSMPKPVQVLLCLVHVDKAEIPRERKEDFAILELLMSQHPQLYQCLNNVFRPRSMCPIVIDHDARQAGTSH